MHSKIAVLITALLISIPVRASEWEEFLTKPFKLDTEHPCDGCHVCCSELPEDSTELSISGPASLQNKAWPVELVRTFMPTLDSGGVKKKDINEFIFMNYAGGNLRKIIIDEQQMDILSYEADLWLNISWEMLRVESTNPAASVNVTVASAIKIWF